MPRSWRWPLGGGNKLTVTLLTLDEAMMMAMSMAKGRGRRRFQALRQKSIPWIQILFHGGKFVMTEKFLSKPWRQLTHHCIMSREINVIPQIFLWMQFLGGWLGFVKLEAIWTPMIGIRGPLEGTPFTSESHVPGRIEGWLEAGMPVFKFFLEFTFWPSCASLKS